MAHWQCHVFLIICDRKFVEKEFIHIFKNNCSFSNSFILTYLFRRNQQSKLELERDWSDKWEAYNIDTTCAHMKNTSSEQIAFYTGPQRIPNKYVYF